MTTKDMLKIWEKNPKEIFTIICIEEICPKCGKYWEAPDEYYSFQGDYSDWTYDENCQKDLREAYKDWQDEELEHIQGNEYYLIRPDVDYRVCDECEAKIKEEEEQEEEEEEDDEDAGTIPPFEFWK